MPDLPLDWHSYLVPKDGHSVDECEDSIAGDERLGRFAIADGATESYAAGEWARLLTSAFLATGANDDWLAEPRKAWRAAAAGAARSWYEEEKVLTGGHATFLGLSITKTDTGHAWDAIAVGDACLFVINGGALHSTFPLKRSSQFSASTSLISSLHSSNNWKRDRGPLQPGDVLLLATDALAKYLVQSSEKGNFAGANLIDMEDDDFSLWVAANRGSGQMRNDDVALGVIKWCWASTSAEDL